MPIICRKSPCNCLDIHFFAGEKLLIEITKENLENGLYISRERETKKKTRRAKCWDTIHEIIDVDTDTKVKNVFLCTVCKNVVHNKSKDGNTMAFNRHVCYAKSNEKTDHKRILVSKEEKEKLVAACTSFVVKDYRPFKAIECEGLMDLCEAAMQFGQKYTKATAENLKENWPSRFVVLHNVGKLASDVEKDIRKVMQMAKNQNGLGATTDCWTDNYQRRSYMCITVHATLMEESQIQNYRFVVCMECITELVKTKKVIVDAILNCFESYGYSEEDVTKFVTFVSDRGPNIRYGLEERGYILLHCYAHMLNNLTAKMLNLPELQTILNNCNQLCAYMKNTGLNSRLKTTLKAWSRSRWNGVCIMMGSVLEADFNLITEILLEKQRLTKTDLVKMITVLHKDEIQPIYEFLHEIKKWSDLLEGEIDETLHFVWPAFLSIQKILQEDMSGYDENETVLVELMKTEGRSYLQKNINDFTPKKSHKFAAVLHPLMRKLPNIEMNERKAVYDEIEAELKAFEVEARSDETIVEVNSARVTEIKKTKIKALSDFFEAQPVHDLKDKPSELERYLNIQLNIDPENFNLKTWWFFNRTDFPNLVKMYCRYLSIPATSAASERNFSETGLVITNRRNALLPQNVKNLVIARNILKNKK